MNLNVCGAPEGSYMWDFGCFIKSVHMSTVSTNEVMIGCKVQKVS